ncbi:rho GTPase-activating protein 15 [Clupea harengus]|uniref:Rho GTPase-activating protein 15 n=1 Tax=Clupea harengus TaxID=7950 RepID=A0A6P3VXG6_CLUHA|nr:rho GTPase-activating protein 15 [Clupea harengus]
MAGTRITNMQTAAKPQALLLPPLGPVQLRMKTSNSSGERLSQTKSMVIPEPETPGKPISRHRRNQSQHSIGGPSGAELSVPLQSAYLNKAKIAEGGKKLRKNWTTAWVVLGSDHLVFYKESKQEALVNLKPGNRPGEVNLGGAIVEWTKEKSSRKNVIQIITSIGDEYLLQSDDFPTMSKWREAIKLTADRSCSGAGRQMARPGLQRSNSTEFLSRRALEVPAAKEPKPEHRRSLMFSSGKLKHSASDSADKNGVKNRLKKFISRRPSMKTLQEKGLIKDRVFGCHLLTLCSREGTTVPKFIRLCIQEVERRGLEADGIYRVSGNLATIQKLRFKVDQEEELNLGDSQWEDIHVITGALKLFFRELPEPLFPFRFFEQFVEAIKNKDPRQKVQVVKKLVNQLPKPNHNTMKLLFKHLQTLLRHSLKNLMSTQGISIVFGPTLMWPENDGGNMAFNMVYQNQIIEYILIESREIFGTEDI